jgi:hypothetical protein
MPLPTRSSRALAMVSFPVVLTLGILTIPVVVDYRDHDLAARAATHSVRWFWGHMFTGAAFGLATVAACAMAGCLLRTRHARWVYVGMPMMAVGAALHAVGLGADGIAPLAVIAGGGRAQTFFDGSGGLVSGVFLAGAVAFGVGLMVHGATPGALPYWDPVLPPAADGVSVGHRFHGIRGGALGVGIVRRSGCQLGRLRDCCRLDVAMAWLSTA